MNNVIHACGAAHFSPLHRVPEHDDEAGVGLQGVHEVLDEEGRLAPGSVLVEIHPGVVVPHSGSTGFTWWDDHRSHAQIKTSKQTTEQSFREVRSATSLLDEVAESW